MTSLVIQALKTLGRSNVTPAVIQMLSEKLTDKDKQACLKEATESTDWVYGKRLIFRYDRKNPRLLFSSRSTLTVHI